MLNATHGTGAYTEKVTSYDKNGNIKALQRYGNGLIDDLTYTYSGNQLTRVDDATGSSAGFSNGASTTNEYVYDNNGNLTKDSNKGITSIAYNCLNLPSKVTFSDGSTIVYSYAADGTKLRTYIPSAVLPRRRIIVRMWSMKMASRRCCLLRKVMWICPLQLRLTIIT